MKWIEAEQVNQKPTVGLGYSLSSYLLTVTMNTKVVAVSSIPSTIIYWGVLSDEMAIRTCAETKLTWSSLERWDHSTWMVRLKQMTKPKYFITVFHNYKHEKYSRFTINVACINRLVKTGYYKWYLTSRNISWPIIWTFCLSQVN